MDKETLSNYGWIVIAVLVLVVMIALATPFGSFVSEAVQSTTKGLFDVNKSALDSTGLINIDNQEFDVPDMNHGAGQSPVTPETPAEPQPTLIAFTIDGVSYQAEEGMTWAEWLASDYNTTGKTNPTIKTSTFADVSYDDVIKANESYGFFTATRLAPGLYQTGTSNLLYSWQELLDSGVIYLTDVAWYPKGVYVNNKIAWDEFNSLAGDLVLPDDGSIETLGFEGFCGGENVTSVIMPDSIRFIEDCCFGGCTKLKSVVIGSNLENIAELAFSGCTSLTSITFKGTVAQWNAVTFERDWNKNVPATYVQCRDGNAPIS